MEEPDPALIRAAVGGDVDAFAELVRAHQPLVWRYLVGFLGDRDLAADVGQDTFVRAFQRIGSFRFESRFSTWLIAIARNQALDACRSDERRRRYEDQTPEHGRPSDPAGRSEIQSAIDALADRPREALLLVEVWGLRYREAALVLDVPVGTVKSRVHQARSALACWYAADDAAPQPGGVPRPDSGPFTHETAPLRDLRADGEGA